VDTGSIATPDASTGLTVVNSSASGDGVQLSLVSGTSGYGQIWFGDVDDENRGRFHYNQSTDTFGWNTATVGSMELSGGGTPTLEFAGAAIISTVSGSLTLGGNGNVIMDVSVANAAFKIVNPSAASIFEIDSRTTKDNILILVTPVAVTDTAAADTSRATMEFAASTLTLTGSTGVNSLDAGLVVRQLTITDASALTVAQAQTVYIAGAPIAAGSVTITEPLALWVDDGTSRFDGDINLNSTGTLLNIGTSGFNITGSGLVNVAGNTRQDWSNGALTVAKASGTGQVIIEAFSTTASAGAYINMARSNSNTLGGFTAVDSSDMLATIAFRGSHGSAHGTGAKFQATATQTWSSGAHGTKIEIYTADNSSTTLDVRMTIEQDGVITIPGNINLSSSGSLIGAAGVIVIDDKLLALGNGADIGQMNRSTILAANTGLAGVLQGTPVTQGIAANSYIFGNTTADGDALYAVNDGGTSKEFLHANGDTAEVTLGHGMTTTVIKTAAGDVANYTATQSAHLGAAIVTSVGHRWGGAFSCVVGSPGTMYQYAGVLTGFAGETINYFDIGGAGAIVEASTDTHGLVTLVKLTSPTIADVGASITNTAMLFMSGAMSATVSGANYAVWVDAGLSRFDGGIDFNNEGTILNVGASGNDWTQNALTLAGGTSDQAITVATNGQSSTAKLILKIPVDGGSSSSCVGIDFVEGTGAGSASNMAYSINYCAGLGYMRLSSYDIDGASADGDVWRVVDGTDDLQVMGGLSTDGVSAPTAGLAIGSHLLANTSVDSAAVADQVAFGRYDIGASNTVIAMSQETAVAVEVDETKFSHKMQVRLNGATYYMMLTTT
jgi:hypothetical protein